MIDMLPQERWPELKEIFEREFESDIPHRESSAIIADMDEDGNINGFVVTETMIRVGCIYKTGKTSRAIFEWLIDRMPKGAVVIAIASSERFEPLCESFQMLPVEGKVFRRDFS